MASFGEETEVVTSDFWKGRGNELYKSKDYKGAIDAYSQAIALDTTNASLLTNRAAAMLMVQMYKEAAADCEAAIQLEPTNAKAYFRKATAIKCLGRVDEAIVILNKGLVHDPTSATALQEKTLLTNCKQRVDEIKVLMAESKQFTMALRQLEQVAKDLGSQNYRDLNLLKIEVLLALDKTEEAYNLSNAMMKVAANGDIELLKVRAQTLYCMGDLENAIKHLQQALRSDPDNSAVRTYYRQIKDIEEKKAAGDLSFKQGEFKAAVDSYTLCLGLLKNKVGSTGAANATFTGKLYLNRATCQAKLKNHEACIKDCHQAIYLNSKYTKAYLRRAESYVALNTPENIEKGISDYEQAYELENDEDACKAIKEKVKKAKVQHKRSKRKDLYSVLGVTNEATEGEIKTAYRKMALKLHPDKQANKTEAEKAEAEKQFKACGEAYEILGDAEKKKRYDEGVEIEDMDNPHAGCGGGHGHHHGHHGGMGGMGGGPGGIDPNILFQMFMQQQGGGRR